MEARGLCAGGARRVGKVAGARRGADAAELTKAI